MNLKERIAVFIGEERYRDVFYGRHVTEHDRNHCRELANNILHFVADDIEKTTIKIPFEAEGYIAGAQDEHTGIVEYLRGLLDI